MLWNVYASILDMWNSLFHLAFADDLTVMINYCQVLPLDCWENIQRRNRVALYEVTASQGYVMLSQ